MDNQYQMKFLGVELVPANGRYRVTHVYRDGPADKERLDIEAGDYVLAIDGREVRKDSPGPSPGSLARDSQHASWRFPIPAHKFGWAPSSYCKT